jgi:hypothetical protein
MKGNFLRFASVGMLILISISALSQTIWNGSPITFTKANYANWTLPENQDRIMDDIWITRANTKPIFNFAVDNLDLSPKDTRWAVGSISDGVETLTFDSWIATIAENPPNMVGIDMVLYLVSEDIYMDIKFTSWTSGMGNGGGGFSYERSTGDISERLWTGPITTFTKADYADWTLAENQDRITDNVWITRADSLGIFNIALEKSYDLYNGFTPTIVSSPIDTRWAFGSISDGIESLSFDTWALAILQNPPEMVGFDMVLFLVTDSIYIDITFTSWTSGQGTGGGGFSYERSTGDISETLWTGPSTTFTKADYADWTLAENQDRITDNVWITRADQQGIFNIAKEDDYLFTSSTPSNTLWAFGNTDDGIASLSFDYFLETIDYEPPAMLDRDMVLQLVPYDIYIDIRFTSWTTGDVVGGGGFSYIRATAPANAIDETSVQSDHILCYPNPATDHIRIQSTSDLNQATFELFDINGRKILSEYLDEEATVAVQHVRSGLYFYKLTIDNSTFNGKILIE